MQQAPGPLHITNPIYPLFFSNQVQQNNGLASVGLPLNLSSTSNILSAASEGSFKNVDVQQLSSDGQEAFQPLNDLPIRALVNQVRTQNALKNVVNYVEKLENKLEASKQALLKYEQAILDSDITIEVEGGKDISINKEILQEKSEYFHAMFSHPMTESVTSTVSIHDAHPEAVKLMIINMISSRIPPKKTHFMVIVSLAELANRFALPDLLKAVSQFVESSDCDETTDLSINLLKSCQVYLEHEYMGCLWQQIYDLCCLKLAFRVPEVRQHALFANLSLRELMDILKLVPELPKEWHSVKIPVCESRSISEDIQGSAAPMSQTPVFRAWVEHDTPVTVTTPRFIWIIDNGSKDQKQNQDHWGCLDWPVLFDFYLKNSWNMSPDSAYSETLPMFPGSSNPTWKDETKVVATTSIGGSPQEGQFLTIDAAIVMSQAQYIVDIARQWAEAQRIELLKEPEHSSSQNPKDLIVFTKDKLVLHTNATSLKLDQTDKSEQNSLKFKDPIELLYFISRVAAEEGILNWPNYKLILADSLSKHIMHSFNFFYASDYIKDLDKETVASIIADDDLFTINELQVLHALISWSLGSKNEELLQEDTQELLVCIPNKTTGGKVGRISEVRMANTNTSVLVLVGSNLEEMPISEVKIFRNPSTLLPLVRFPFVAKKDLQNLPSLEWHILKSLPVMQELLQEALHLQNFPREARQSICNTPLKSHNISVCKTPGKYGSEPETEDASSEGEEQIALEPDVTRQLKKRRKRGDLNQNRKKPRSYFKDSQIPYFQMEDVINCFET